MPFLRILGLSVAAAVLYGIAHDQVTARVCVEYFTVGHPPMPWWAPTHDPTLLAFLWGVAATWWMGVLLGLPLGLAARAGPWPKRGARSLLRPVGWLLLAMAAASVVAGVLGWTAAERGAVFLGEPLASRVPEERHVAFLADLWAHQAAYGVGALGGLGLAAGVLVRRIRRGREASATEDDLSRPAGA